MGALTLVALFGRRKFLVVGWFWFLITLAPVIGLVQVGGQARADRYTYIPLIGVFVMAAWGIPELLDRLAGPQRRALMAKTLAVVSVVAVAVLAAAARIQVGYWRDSATLFGRAVAVTEDNWFAHNWFGFALARQGRLDEAEAHIRQAIALVPADPTAHYNLGVVLVDKRRFDEAVVEYREALRLRPGWGDAHANLGEALRTLGRLDEAAGEFAAALAANPDNSSVHTNLGAILLMRKDFSEAEGHFRAAARLSPADPLPHCNLAIVHAYRNEFSSAWAEIDACRRLGGQPTAGLEEDLARVAPRPAP